MGKHGGKKAEEPGTDLGIPFSKMNGTQKGIEFDQSDADPVGYAKRNFTSQENSAPNGKRGKK